MGTDYRGPASNTFSGRVVLPASIAGSSSLNVPHGTAPSSPVDGDVWTTTAGMYVRVNGTTIGPLSAGGGTPASSVTTLDGLQAAVVGTGTAYARDDHKHAVINVVDLSSSQTIGGSKTFSSQLNVASTADAAGFSRFSASANGPAAFFNKSRNAAVNSHTVVQVNDTLGALIFSGSDGAAFQQAAAIFGNVASAGTISNVSMPGILSFRASANGSISPTERAQVNSSGLTVRNGWVYVRYAGDTADVITLLNTGEVAAVKLRATAASSNAFYTDGEYWTLHTAVRAEDVSGGGILTLGAVSNPTTAEQLVKFANGAATNSTPTRLWDLGKDSTTITGAGNAGGDFVIRNYTDGGVLIGTPVKIKRSSGDVTFASTVISGTGDGSGTPVGGTLRAPDAVGTNIAGGTLNLSGGASTGATFSTIVLKGAVTGSSGAGVNTPAQIASFTWIGQVLGIGDTTATPGTARLYAPRASGTNITGGALQLIAGYGTGTGAGGPISLFTGPAGSSGSGGNNVVERLRVDYAGTTVASPSATFPTPATTAAATPSLLLRRATDTTPTASIQEWQTAAGTVLASVSALGQLKLLTGTTSAAPLNLPSGSAPSTPAAGDVWATSSGIYQSVGVASNTSRVPGVVNFARCSADSSAATTGTYVIPTGFPSTIPLKSGRTYKVEILGYYQCAATTYAPRHRLAYPSLTAGSMSMFSFSGASTSTQTGSAVTLGASPTTFVSANAGGANTSYYFKLEGFLIPSADGNLVYDFTPNAAGTMKVMAGTYIMVTEVG